MSCILLSIVVVILLRNVGCIIVDFLDYIDYIYRKFAKNDCVDDAWEERK